MFYLSIYLSVPNLTEFEKVRNKQIIFKNELKKLDVPKHGSKKKVKKKSAKNA